MSKIRVRYGPGAPWTTVIRNGNTTTLGGMARDIYDVVSRALNLEFVLKLQEDLKFGSRLPNGKWIGMLGSVQDNETDLCGPFFITEERAELVEFSIPVGYSHLAITSGLEAGNRSPFVIVKVFSMHVWLAMMMSLILVIAAASLIYIVMPARKKRSKGETFLIFMWVFYATLLGKDTGPPSSWYLRHIWATNSFRILLCMWLTGPVTVLMYTYQSAVTSTLSADKLKPIAQSLDDIEKSDKLHPSTLSNSYVSNCFKKFEGTTRNSLYVRMFQNLRERSTNVYPEYMDEVETGSIAFIGETIVMKGFIGDRFKHTGKCAIRVTPTDFCTTSIGFAFRRGLKAEFKDVFNQRQEMVVKSANFSLILTLFYRTLWYTEGSLAHRHILASTFKYDACTREKSSAVAALNLKDFLGAFLIYAAGICISVFIFFIERLVHSMKSK